MSIKVDMESGTLSMRVRFPARTWELAHEVIALLKEDPPEGYRLVESTMKPRGEKKSGRRCNVSLRFNYVDDRVPPMATSGAKAFFALYSLKAQGVIE
jgi:hypothetical protein